MTADERPPKGGLGTIRNATLLMDLLAQPPHLHQLSELAQRSEMTVPTVHRLLRSLVHAEYAVQDPATSRYGLGPALTRLAVRQLENSTVLAALNPYLASLRDQVGATLGVHVLISGEAVCVDQVDAGDRGPFRRPLRAVPAFDSAAGRILASHGPPAEWERLVAELQPGAAATLLDLSGHAPEGTSVASALRTLWNTAPHLVRRSEDPSESDELAVPVRCADGSVVAALSADLHPAEDPARLVPLLTRTAASGGRNIPHA